MKRSSSVLLLIPVSYTVALLLLVTVVASRCGG